MLLIYLQKANLTCLQDPASKRPAVNVELLHEIAIALAW